MNFRLPNGDRSRSAEKYPEESVEWLLLLLGFCCTSGSLPLLPNVILKTFTMGYGHMTTPCMIHWTQRKPVFRFYGIT